ncbi:outer membrane beta-barrel family protein [Dinghuibacter silviterrae]|uniref:Outer membrane receptor protein involved in Fe transport n=1 Tax=Dinghuibacter silviterrae TaxID=1539049 RepID=A0A4R8DV77_9BACT|nr:outer membrane beta-barrel family protein [Dinghuibacter silviterrae]TDX01317.1 outer membrane receptor protein involved in Fe transport [Dinghuibacter silviterrae]
MRKLLVLLILFALRAGAQTPDTARRDTRGHAAAQRPDTAKPAPEGADTMVRAAPGADTARRIQLGDIRIAAPPIERRLDKTVINLDQRITTAGATVLEALQHLPGVHVSADGAITMTGGRGATVFIDGKPTYLSSADLAGLLNGMSASGVQRIEIITNPPSKYDASGTGAIINIVRKRNRKQGFSGSVNGSLVSEHYGQYHGGVMAVYKNDHVNLYVSDAYTYGKQLGDRYLTSDIEDAHGALLAEEVSNNRTVNGWRSDNPAVGIDWYASARTTLSLSAMGAVGTTSFDTHSSLETTDGHRVPVQYEDFSALNVDHPYHYFTTLQWSQALDTAGRNLTVDADYARFDYHPVQTTHGLFYDTSGQYTGASDTLLPEHRRMRIYSAQADYTHPFKNGRWEAGVKTSESFITDSTQSTEWIEAAYATMDRSYKKWEVQAGLRVEKDALRDTVSRWRYLQLFPTLFLRFEKAFFLRLGRRTDRPDYHEMNPFRRPLTPTLYFQGNPYLRPDLTWHGELGWTWRNIFTITFMMDRDHDYMRTLPYVDPGDSTITRRPTNVEGHSWNLDLTFTKALTRWWTTDNALSFFQNAFAGDPDSLWRADRGILAVYLSFDNTFTLSRRLSAEVDGEYDSEHQLVSSWFGPYYMVNAALKWTFKKGSLSLNANNIFQSEGNHGSDHYTGLSQFSVSGFYTRSVSLTATYRFGSGKATHSDVRSSAEEERRRAGG